MRVSIYELGAYLHSVLTLYTVQLSSPGKLDILEQLLPFPVMYISFWLVYWNNVQISIEKNYPSECSNYSVLFLLFSLYYQWRHRVLALNCKRPAWLRLIPVKLFAVLSFLACNFESFLDWTRACKVRFHNLQNLTHFSVNSLKKQV